MILYLFEIISLLIFWRFADFSRFSKLIPLMFTGAFIRFLDHYIIIDWLKLWTIKGDSLWIPFSANISIWVIAAYFFIQWVPKRHRFLYTLGWSGLLTLYLTILKWNHIFTPKVKWPMYYSLLNVMVYFGLLYVVWKWLYPQKSPKQNM